jgi:hypothetical protein
MVLTAGNRPALHLTTIKSLLKGGETLEYLTTKQVAELQGCTIQYIRRLVQNGTITSVETPNEKNHKKYLIPISSLDPTLQRRWYQNNHQPLPSDLKKDKQSPKPMQSRTLEEMSADEREQVSWWIRILDDWDSARSGAANKTEADAAYIKKVELEEGVKLSYGSLRRHMIARQTNNLDGLVDGRGKHRAGQSTIDDEAWQVFLSFWLDQRRFSAVKCYEYTGMYLQSIGKPTELPHISSFRRRIEADVPESIKILGRDGDKAYRDRCAPYITRIYDDLESNDWWVADNHTFDVISRDGDIRHRLYLTAFFDVRSGIFTGLYVTDKPCSQATLLALRNGIIKYGIPRNILVDNGREFLTYDVGGLGHRQKKSTKDAFNPPPVFERMGIKMVNALPRNARAKIIERRFLDVKNGLSKLFATYTGGNVLEKPENLKDAIRAGNIPDDAQFKQAVLDILEGYFNQQIYNGPVAADRGKTHQQIYNEHLHVKRTAPEEDLNLMLMRSSRPQKVGRDGVVFKIEGCKIPYWTDEFITAMSGKQVYYRYDPDDLSKVRAYDLQDRFLCELPARNETVLKYGASVEDVSSAMKSLRAAERYAQSGLAQLINPDISPDTAFQLVLQNAIANKENPPVDPANPKVLEIHRPNETPLIRAAVGYDIDMLDTMIENAEKRNIGGNDYGNL